MWISRILQVLSLFLAAATVLIFVGITITLPLPDASNQGYLVPGTFYFLLFLGPAALLFLIIGTTSNLFLASKKRRAAYGFNTGPWRSVMWINICALIVLVWSPIAMALTFSLVGYLIA
jgi:hypothetical protein